MIINNIFYDNDFLSDFKKLEKNLQKRAGLKLEIFKESPLHPSLRLHILKGKLKGLWSISINGSCRIIFKNEERGDVILLSIGKHDIYKSL